MKPLKRKFASSLALFTFLSAVQFASAFYDPSLGRWLSRDPIGLRGGVNTYRFLKNDPTTAFDTFGLFSTPNDAAKDALQLWNPISICENKEHCGQLCIDNVTGEYTSTYGPGSEFSCPPASYPCPPARVKLAHGTRMGIIKIPINTASTTCLVLGIMITVKTVGPAF
jgi:hypothetical protein